MLARILSYTEFAKLSYRQFMTLRRYAWRFNRILNIIMMSIKHQVIFICFTISTRSNSDVVHAVDSVVFCWCMCHVDVFIILRKQLVIMSLLWVWFSSLCFTVSFMSHYYYFLITLTSQSVFRHPSCKLLDRRLFWHIVPRETGVARGEAPREAPVPVPGESVCDSSRVPSRGPLVCRVMAISFLFDLVVINIVNILGHT